MLKINADNFKSEVLESDIPVLVDFATDWCGPCRQLKPVLEQLSDDSNGKYKIVTINTDDSIDLANEYSINAIPTLVVFKNGTETERLEGIQTKAKLESILSQPNENWIITVELSKFNVVVEEIKNTGFKVVDTLETVGCVTGEADKFIIQEIEKISGVIAVEADAQYHIWEPPAQ